ncbi:hypothetical protein [Pyruvatibacter mobilis]|uniref:hypothetical protein n=1 Tax=Pyruvatibacter mobilis TaxID=1712261 RepID=UPI003D0BAE6D
MLNADVASCSSWGWKPLGLEIERRFGRLVVRVRLPYGSRVAVSFSALGFNFSIWRRP